MKARPSHLRVYDASTPAPAPDVSDIEGLFRAHSGYVATIAWKLLGRTDEIDDLVQDVFLQALTGLRELRQPEAIRGWLAVVTVRMARRKLRRRRMWAVLGLDTPADCDAVALPQASPHDRALFAQVYATLDALPVNERVAWLLRHAAGEQHERIASLCGCSVATVKRRIATAQRVLEKRFG